MKLASVEWDYRDNSLWVRGKLTCTEEWETKETVDAVGCFIGSDLGEAVIQHMKDALITGSYEEVVWGSNSCVTEIGHVWTKILPQYLDTRYPSKILTRDLLIISELYLPIHRATNAAHALMHGGQLKDS